MLSKASVMNGLQSALPQAKLMWEGIVPGEAWITITTSEAEHYVAVCLSEPGLTAEQLVANIVATLA